MRKENLTSKNKIFVFIKGPVISGNGGSKFSKISNISGYSASFHSLDWITKRVLQCTEQAVGVAILASFNLKSHGKKLVTRTLKQKLGDHLNKEQTKGRGKLCARIAHLQLQYPWSPK